MLSVALKLEPPRAARWAVCTAARSITSSPNTRAGKGFVLVFALATLASLNGVPFMGRELSI